MHLLQWITRSRCTYVVLVNPRAWLKTHEKYKEIKETLRKRETEGFPRSARSTDRDRERRPRDPDKDRDKWVS